MPPARRFVCCSAAESHKADRWRLSPALRVVELSSRTWSPSSRGRLKSSTGSCRLLAAVFPETTSQHSSPSSPFSGLLKARCWHKGRPNFPSHTPPTKRRGTAAEVEGGRLFALVSGEGDSPEECPNERDFIMQRIVNEIARKAEQSIGFQRGAGSEEWHPEPHVSPWGNLSQFP